MWDFEFRVLGFEFGDSKFALRVSSFELRVLGLGFRVLGFGYQDLPVSSTPGHTWKVHNASFPFSSSSLLLASLDLSYTGVYEYTRALLETAS